MKKRGASAIPFRLVVEGNKLYVFEDGDEYPGKLWAEYVDEQAAELAAREIMEFGF